MSPWSNNLAPPGKLTGCMTAAISSNAPASSSCRTPTRSSARPAACMSIYRSLIGTRPRCLDDLRVFFDIARDHLLELPGRAADGISAFALDVALDRGVCQRLDDVR